MHARLRQLRVIAGLKSIELLRVEFMRAVTAVQFVFKVDAYLVHNGPAGLARGCDLNGGNKIFLSVSTDDADGQLRTGEHHGLAQILEHKTESRCRVRHGIRTVQDHEAM